MKRKSLYKSKKGGKEYVITSIQLEKELWDKLIEIGPKMYGVSRGWLSPIVNEALRMWLSPRIHATHANPPRKVWAKFKEVKKTIAEILGIPVEEIKECTEKQLEIAITMTIGSDKRTIEKYKQLFEKLGLIKNMSPNAPRGKRVYELLG